MKISPFDKLRVILSKVEVSNFKKGFTLIEVLIGIFLTLIVFSGIFGVYRLSLKVISQSKSKIIATAVASGQIEKIKNLPYESIGIKGGFPDGVLEAVTTTVQNNIQYTIEKRVDYIIDPTDGVAPPEDECPNDYKRVEVKISWSGIFSSQVVFATDIAPKNLTQECAVGGGILSVLVFDAYGVPVISPLIEIKDPVTDQTLKTAIPAEGQYNFSLTASTSDNPLATSTYYKVVVSKDGYSSERTYGTDEITTPEKPNPLIIEEQFTPISFSVDKLSSFSVDTFSSWGQGIFSDSFLNESKISDSLNITVNDENVKLATDTEGYLSSGYLISTSIYPTVLLNWDEFSWTDLESEETDLKYQIYFASDTDWLIVPESDLPGNSSGFDLSPVDLSGLNTVVYPKLKIKANFSTNINSDSPTLDDWQVSWVTSEAVPLSNATFNLYGNKSIGKDSQEDPVYKYSISTTTNSIGHKDIQNLEWDLYTFLSEPASELNLVSIQPSPQPVNLLPDTDSSVKLYFSAQNSLLITIEDINTLEPIFAATVRLYRTGCDYAQDTNAKGQTYFIPLSNATYNLEISSLDYSSTSATVYVSGNTTKIIKLEQPE